MIPPAAATRHMTPTTLPAPQAEVDAEIAVQAGLRRPVLVVDLDGTLVRTDTLIEALLAGLARPGALLRAFGALRHGRARFKQAVAEIGKFDPALLLYNEELLAYLRRERKSGRALILATAADRRIAFAVARHLDLFDAVLASDGVVNLKGKAKLAAIRSTLGEHPFVYAGNERADLAIWREADGAILVGAGAGLKRAAAAIARIEQSFDAGIAWPAALRRVTRPHQRSRTR